MSKRAGKIKICCVRERDIDRERREVCLSVVCLLRVGIRYADFGFLFCFSLDAIRKAITQCEK